MSATALPAPAGRLRWTADCIVRDSGLPDEIVHTASQDSVEDSSGRYPRLPARAAATAKRISLSQTAWDLFSATTPGYARVQAICDYVHKHIAFDYMNARSTRTAPRQAFEERTGVCRDYASSRHHFLPGDEHPRALLHRVLQRHRHSAALVRGDFAAWFEAWIGAAGTCLIRVTMCRASAESLCARGRDARDVAITTTFGSNTLEDFKVWTEEIPDVNGSTG